MTPFIASMLLAVAPVPRHLFPPELDAIQPGYRWYFCGDVLEVVEVNGEYVAFRNVTNPAMTWTVSHLLGPNVQTRRQCLDEAKRYGRPPADQ